MLKVLLGTAINGLEYFGDEEDANLVAGVRSLTGKLGEEVPSRIQIKPGSQG